MLTTLSQSTLSSGQSSGRKLQIPTAEVFEPLLEPARYKGAHGGRGSGKSHFFASRMVEDSLAEPGLLSVCIREVQKTLRDSAKRLLEQKLAEFRLGEADGFRVYADRIETPGDGLIIFQGMQDHTAESIKSLEGFRRAWVEEAQTLSSRSLELLRPTIREDQSELWFGWNPRRKSDPVDILLRSDERPTGAKVVEANWRDNPWFPRDLDIERRDCLRSTPAQYDHIWEGGYAKIVSGAYYAREIAELVASHRLGRVARDPLMTLRAFWDIGGTGAKSDARAIWIGQFVGREIRVLDYHETRGQPLAADVEWLRTRGYKSALCVLPHDGDTNDRVYDVSYQSALQSAGFDTQVVQNQGKGAALKRIEATRRLFPSIWINEDTTKAGMDALGAYHAKIDEHRQVDLGPEHDWASHAADAFGLMCMTYETPQENAKQWERRPQRWVV
jgi:phage terminase large subunit